MSDTKYESFRLAERLQVLGPECNSMVRDLLAAGVEFAHEMMDMWDALDEEDKPDLLAFHDGDGVRRVDEIRVKHEDGTPTSADLRNQFDSPGGGE